LKPVDQITLTANLGYTDFSYISLLPQFAAVGSVAPANRSKWTNNFAAQYESDPLFGDARLTFRIDARYASDTLLTTTIPPFRPQAYVDAAHTGNVWIFDSRLSLSDIGIGGGDLQIALWGRNLLNNRRPSYGADLVAAMTTRYEQARTYGVDMTVRF